MQSCIADRNHRALRSLLEAHLGITEAWFWKKFDESHWLSTWPPIAETIISTHEKKKQNGLTINFGVFLYLSALSNEQPVYPAFLQQSIRKQDFTKPWRWWWVCMSKSATVWYMCVCERSICFTPTPHSICSLTVNMSLLFKEIRHGKLTVQSQMLSTISNITSSIVARVYIDIHVC